MAHGGDHQVKVAGIRTMFRTLLDLVGDPWNLQRGVVPINFLDYWYRVPVYLDPAQLAGPGSNPLSVLHDPSPIAILCRLSWTYCQFSVPKFDGKRYFCWDSESLTSSSCCWPVSRLFASCCFILNCLTLTSSFFLRYKALRYAFLASLLVWIVEAS